MAHSAYVQAAQAGSRSKRYVKNEVKDVRQGARHSFGSLKRGRERCVESGRTHVNSRTVSRDVSRVCIRSSD